MDYPRAYTGGFTQCSDTYTAHQMFADLEDWNPASLHHAEALDQDLDDETLRLANR